MREWILLGWNDHEISVEKQKTENHETVVHVAQTFYGNHILLPHPIKKCYRVNNYTDDTVQTAMIVVIVHATAKNGTKSYGIPILQSACILIPFLQFVVLSFNSYVIHTVHLFHHSLLKWLGQDNLLFLVSLGNVLITKKDNVLITFFANLVVLS